MIRQYNNKLVVIESDGTALNLADIYCNSDDTKPTENLANGSKLTEVDTGKTYLFDEDNEEWVEYSAGGGGGGTGGGVGIIDTIEVNSTTYAHKCTNPNAMLYVAQTNDTIYGLVTRILMYSMRATATLDFGNISAYYYDDNGNTVDVTGTHDVIMLSKPCYVGVKEFETIDDMNITAADENISMLVDSGYIIYTSNN